MSKSLLEANVAVATRAAPTPAPRHLGAALALLGVLLAGATSEAAAKRPARVAVVVGANAAASGRPALRYAHDDARRMAEVLSQVGEFRAEDIHVLLDPEPQALLGTLDRQLESLRDLPGETLLLFYYSGHADQRALYPSGRALPLEEVRRRVDTRSATVRLGIIDACRGGGWTQAKGLQEEEASFEVQVPLAVRSEGSVLIASSSGLENAHEAEALQGSFFTHHLVAGLRGAADQAGDGEVSVVEAFSYARELTVRDSALHGRAPQHPSFDFNLRGRADLALTRVASASSRLRVEQHGGALSVLHAASGGAVAELPRAERTATLALPPGRYLVVRKEEAGGTRAREVTLSAGETVSLDEHSLESVGTGALAFKGDDGARRPWAITVGIFPVGNRLPWQGLQFEVERAVSDRTSFALAPAMMRHNEPALTLSGRYFLHGTAPAGLFLGASVFGLYHIPDSDPRYLRFGAGPEAGYSLRYRDFIVSAGVGVRAVREKYWRGAYTYWHQPPWELTPEQQQPVWHTMVLPHMRLNFGVSF